MKRDFTFPSVGTEWMEFRETHCNCGFYSEALSIHAWVVDAPDSVSLSFENCILECRFCLFLPMYVAYRIRPMLLY